MKIEIDIKNTPTLLAAPLASLQAEDQTGTLFYQPSLLADRSQVLSFLLPYSSQIIEINNNRALISSFIINLYV